MAEYSKNNKIITYHSYGGGNSTLLCIHDFGGSSSDFSLLADDLKDSARIITIDLCGHGGSYLPQATVSVKTMARDVVAFIRDCYIGRPNVLGVGAGGAVALEAFNSAPELFKSFVFLDTFVTKSSRSVFGEKVRPLGDNKKETSFRNTFKRWVGAYRDDLFIFINEFDGTDIFRVSANRMLFIYGDRGKSQAITKEIMNLPSYSNIMLTAINNAGRWILDNNYEKTKALIKCFLIDESNDLDYQEENPGKPDSPLIDIDNLMFLR